MIVAVLDSTVLISAFLSPQGGAVALVLNTPPLAFGLYLSFEIVEETKRRLLNRVKLRKRYNYTNGDVEGTLPICTPPRASWSSCPPFKLSAIPTTISF